MRSVLVAEPVLQWSPALPSLASLVALSEQVAVFLLARFEQRLDVQCAHDEHAAGQLKNPWSPVALLQKSLQVLGPSPCVFWHGSYLHFSSPNNMAGPYWPMVPFPTVIVTHLPPLSTFIQPESLTTGLILIRQLGQSDLQ